MVKSTQFRGRLAVGRLPLEQEIDGSNPSPGATMDSNIIPSPGAK